MTNFLNLTFKLTAANKYKMGLVFSPNFNRTIELDQPPEIKDENGRIIAELNNSSEDLSSYKVSEIKKINLAFADFDIPISWAWKNKGIADAEIQLTLKNVKYDETKGLNFSKSVANQPEDTLSLTKRDFETEFLEDDQGIKIYYLRKNIELSDRYPQVRGIFNDFRELSWKITKAYREETVTRFIPEIESYQNASLSDPLKYQFYSLENILTNSKEVESILVKVQNLKNEWQKVGIKTLTDVDIACQNGFDIIRFTSLKSQIKDGKYKGFFIANPEKYQTIGTGFGGTGNSIIAKNRYTKNNIDSFRDFFTNNLDQNDPRYFRGFRPGDIATLFSGKPASCNHLSDIKKKQDNFQEIKAGEEFTRTYYELKSYRENRSFSVYSDTMGIISQSESFNEIMNKNKKEHLDIYHNWFEKFGTNSYVAAVEEKLTNLFSVLDKPSAFYTNESKENCETTLNILKDYESSIEDSGEKLVQDRFSAEINAKKTEITDRMNSLRSMAIDTATNEVWEGFGSLNGERKRIFTTYRDQIETDNILAEIKKLIKLLLQGEKIIPQKNRLEKMVLANKLKEEYQNGQEDKKVAYDIVDKVDNKWVDRTITDLEKFEKKEITLEERRTQLQAQYGNSVVAQTVFGNSVLDCLESLEEAEKLLIKTQTALEEQDTNPNLLSFLQDYQQASDGSIKNKSWIAVNSYQQQGEAAIKHLQKNYQSREEVSKGIQEAQTESELEAAYNQAKNSKLYEQGGKSKVVIDNLHQRKKVLLQIEQDAGISSENKTFLKKILVKIIPDTLKNDNDEQELTQLENQLKSFCTSKDSEEKRKIYQNNKRLLDQLLTEISEEKQRYQRTKVNENNNKQSQKELNRLPKWGWGLIIVGSIVAVGILFIIYKRNWRKTSKISNK